MSLPAPSDDPVVTLWVTAERRAYPLQTPASTREVAIAILKRREYDLLDLPGYVPETVLDIGANVGAYTLFCAIHYPGCRIFSYEPVAASYALLVSNTAGLEGVVAHPVGLLDRDAELPIYPGTDNPGEHSIHRGAQQAPVAAGLVTLRRAATEISRLGLDSLSVLKLDTEGCEVAILTDLAPWLDRIDWILLEWHRDADRREIERLLGDRFILYDARVERLHRGFFKYVARRVLDAYPGLADYCRSEESK